MSAVFFADRHLVHPHILPVVEAARTGTKPAASGDPEQLQAGGVGGWLREVHRLVDGEARTENRRQEPEVERAALEVWRTGDHQRALEMLGAGGWAHAVATAARAPGEAALSPVSLGRPPGRRTW
ncbi:AAA family ATPase [Streptomyces sp. NRRL F-2580]|uniref:AAA family ATPase n=1 Tax=Streptomyces sp. NRRL F-2580 TaxID=1463841 RepID=UPI000D144622|nr:AAA family ATPase [Streptomyces sp. NRRL F-2580]